jgi:hypothetical protein
MNLPFFKKSSSAKSKREYLFTLEIGYEMVRSAIWAVVNEKTQVLSIGKTVGCNPSLEDSFLPACDQTLTDSTNHLDSTGKIQPEKVILGLPVNWVSQDKIEPDKLHLLRNLSQKLSLKAIGFVVTPQALVRYLQHSEGVPPTTILIGLWQTTIEVTQVRLGQIEATQAVKRSSKLTADVVEGLSRRVPTGMLPSRMLLYDSGSDLDSIKQNLLAFPWQAPQTKLPFLHFPKIEILPPDFSVKAISLAGGSEVAQAIGLITQTSPPEASSETENIISSAQDLGFVAETDIATLPQEPLPPSPEPQLEEPKPPRQKIKLPSFKFPAINFHLPLFPRSIKTFFGIFILILALVGTFGAYWFLPKATVTIEVTPQSLQHEINITADLDASSFNLENHILPASSIQVNVSSQKSKPTTGSLLTGDKATGEVTVINGTTSPRSFPAGTTITSPSGLKFSFDSGIEVASASGTADPNSYQPGKANVKITASAIGNEYNLTAGTQFKIGSFSTLDYVAKNDVAFTGGSSRQVAAVSKQDLTDLRSGLTSSLKDDAKNQLSAKVPSGHQIIPESITTTVISEKFNHALDEAADEINLDLSLKVTAFEFNSSDLDNLINQETATLVPTGYQSADGINHSFSIKGVLDKQIQLAVQITALLIPQLDQDQIIKNISGKYPQAAQSYISGLPGVSRIDFRFLPVLPSQILTLPHYSPNIELIVKPGNQ